VDAAATRSLCLLYRFGTDAWALSIYPRPSFFGWAPVFAIALTGRRLNRETRQSIADVHRQLGR
jgi:hypothetical protein